MPKLLKKQRAHLKAARHRRWKRSPTPSQPHSPQPTVPSLEEHQDDASHSHLTTTSYSHLPASFTHHLSLVAPPPSQPPTSSTALDPSDSDFDFDPEEALKSDPDALLEEFVADWVGSLPREDLYSLSLLLFHILQQDFQLLIGPASKIIASHLKKNPKTIQKWRVDFLMNEGELPEFLRGKYQRKNVISNNEEPTEEATLYVREKCQAK